MNFDLELKSKSETYRSLSIYSDDRQLKMIEIGTVDNIEIWH